MALTRSKQERVLELPFVRRYAGHQIFFDKPYPLHMVKPAINRFFQSSIGSIDIEFFSSAALILRRAADRLKDDIRNPKKFPNLSFGGDVAESDTALLDYFINTRAFDKASRGEASVIIGPKGSGKTAILRSLQAKHGNQNTIVITPEVFATSMLRQVVEGNHGIWEEDQAFTATWIFTILVEVFKRMSENPRGVPSTTLKKLRTFLRAIIPLPNRVY